MATTKKNNYTPINATSAAGINYSKYQDEVEKQKAYLAANPTAAQANSAQEYQEKYGGIVDGIYNTGVYTKDYDAAQEAKKQHGVSVTPTQYNGQDGYYLVDKAVRTKQEGSSGADEGLLNDQDYAIVQSLKNDFANAQSGYNAAVASGNDQLAAQYQAAMDNAHLEAERIRAAYGYSGGQDGSMYITHGALNVDEDYGGNYSGGSYGFTGSVSGGSDNSGGSGSYVSGLTVPAVGDLSANVEDYSAYLEQMYAAQKAAALAQLTAAYEKNVNELDRAEVGVGEQYQAARNQTAGASEQLKRNFAQYAANGLNNGTAGQAELARGVTLQNNLNAINTAEADTLADLQLARANAEVEYNNAIAQAESTGDYELAAALYQEKVRVQEALTELEIQQHEYALKQYQLQYQAQQDAIANQMTADKFAFQQQQYADSLAQSQLEYANSLAQEQQATLAGYGEAYLALGIMPSEEMLAAMGLTEADAQKYIAAVQAEKK